MDLQWYPGHMTKAKRMMTEDIKLIDLVIELLDARCPLASRNPDINELANNKSRLILLNKADLADKDVTEKWKHFFEEQGYFVLNIDSRNQGNLKPVNEIVKKACAEKIERDRKKGIRNRPVRAMVCGIPNVGKSTFINSYSKKASAKTGNKPGVTKGKQWIRLSNSLELLDTPGILWPKFEDKSVGLKLAMIGSIKDEIMNVEELALEIISYLNDNYPGCLEEVYGISRAEVDSGNDEGIAQESVRLGNADEKKSALYNQEKSQYVEILNEIARVRGCLAKGGEYDLLKASNILLENFRNGKLGRISLESPE